MYYYNNELPPQQGWICPKCGRVNAPWLPTCGCVSSQTRATFDTTSLTAEQTEPSTDGYACLKKVGVKAKQTEPNCQKCKWWNGEELKCSISSVSDCDYEQTEPSTEERLKDIMTKALTTDFTDCSWKKGE